MSIYLHAPQHLCHIISQYQVQERMEGLVVEEVEEVRSLWNVKGIF